MKIEEITIPHQLLNVTEKMCEKILDSPQKYSETEVMYTELFLTLLKSKQNFVKWFQRRYQATPENFYKEKLKKFLAESETRNVNEEVNDFLREHLLFLIILKEFSGEILHKELLRKLSQRCSSTNLQLCLLLIERKLNFEEVEKLISEILIGENFLEEKIYSIYITWYLKSVLNNKKKELLLFHYKFLKNILSFLNKEGLLEIEIASPRLRIYLIKSSIMLYFCNYEKSITLNKLETINYVDTVIEKGALVDILSDVLERTLHLEVTIPKIEAKVSISFKQCVQIMTALSILLTFSLYFDFLPSLRFPISILLTLFTSIFLLNMWKLKEKIIDGVKYGNKYERKKEL